MVKVGIVGTGLIATVKHLPAWKRIKDVEVVALCDVNVERGSEVASRFGVPKVYGSLSELLEKEQPDIIDICTPPASHAKLAIEALSSGAHVFVEKPMALDAAECDAMIAAARAAGRQLCVGHSDLFYPAFLEARRIVERGELGAFRGMRIFLSTPTDYMTSKSDHWANKLPGGVIGESGPHVVYLALAFLDEVKDVNVVATKLLPSYPWSRFEDYRVTLRGEKGVADVALTYGSAAWAAEVDIICEKGLLRVDLESQTLVRHERKDLRAPTVARSALGDAWSRFAGVARTSLRYATGRRENTHDLLLKGFVRAIQTGAPPPVTAEQGREAVRVMATIAKQCDAQG